MRIDTAIIVGSVIGFGVHSLLSAMWSLTGTPTNMAILGALVMLGIILEHRLPPTTDSHETKR